MENPETRLKLPKDLCQQMLNIEMEVEMGNVTEEIISKVVELYVEAMTFFMNQAALDATRLPFGETPPSMKGHSYYQSKIKKFLCRNDVQKCLLGEKVYEKGINLQIELNKAKDSIPQQAKALIEYYKKYHKEQRALITKTVEEQNKKLEERIARRSRSKSNRQSIDQKENNIFSANLSFYQDNKKVFI